MVRLILGAALAAVAMLVAGFIFFATPLNGLGTRSLGDEQAGQMQASLKTIIPATGTYAVPNDDTAAQTVMYGSGPVATVHFNASGYAAGDATMLIWGLALNFVAALLTGFGLLALGGRIGDFPSRARLVILLAVGAALYIHLGRALYLHHDLANVLYTLVGDALALALGGLVVAWFLPSTARPAAITHKLMDRETDLEKH
jgi:hypothetical protein